MFNFLCAVVTALYLAAVSLVAVVWGKVLPPEYLVPAAVALVAAVWLTIWLVGRRRLRNLLVREAHEAQLAWEENQTLANAKKWRRAKFDLDEAEGRIRVVLGTLAFHQRASVTTLDTPPGFGNNPLVPPAPGTGGTPTP